MADLPTCCGATTTPPPTTTTDYTKWLLLLGLGYVALKVVTKKEK